MTSEVETKFIEACTAIRLSAIAVNSKWEYDERFETALTCLPSDSLGPIVTVLEENLGFRWDHKSVKKSSKVLKQIIKDFMGLKKEQLCFSSDLEAEYFLVGLWWPWADGEKVSLRIGLFPNVQDSEMTADEVNFIKSTFLL